MSLEKVFLEKIESGDETAALKFLKENYHQIDVNKVIANRAPIFSAMNSNMHKLSASIISHPRFNPNIEDGFGESLLQSFIYFSNSEEKEEYRNFVNELINDLLGNSNLDVNQKDLNDDTALITCAYFPAASWIVERLLKFPNIDVNAINDFGNDALGTAIKENNVEVLKVICSSGKAKITDTNIKVAREKGIDLDSIMSSNECYSISHK